MSKSTRTKLNDSKMSVGSSNSPRLSWPEMEVLSLPQLIEQLRGLNRTLSPIGTKVVIMCRIRAFQHPSFSGSKMLQMEEDVVKEYRLWRLGNISILGSTEDPEYKNYVLFPPKLLSGEAMSVSFDRLLGSSLRQQDLIQYLRDHFAGVSVTGTKAVLACRIKALLRNPRELLVGLELKEAEKAEQMGLDRIFNGRVSASNMKDN